MVENLKEAREYAKKIENGEVENPLLSSEFLHALKELAKAKDEGSFRKIVDFVADLIKKDKKSPLKFFNKEPLAYLECLIMNVDHGDKGNYLLVQRSRGLDVKRPALRKTQRFFQKLYGSHFFVD